MRTKRAGFSLIELMVAMTLTIFVMVIISQAFIQGLETFSSLKAIGDLQANLRTSSNLLRDDLRQDHFEGGRRLSDPDIVQVRPLEGFFLVKQGGPSIDEGADPPDPGGIHSFRAGDHLLHFTVKLRGNRRESFVSAPSRPSLLAAQTTLFGYPPDALFQEGTNLFSSQWSEVAYFLVQKEVINGLPIFALYRSQFVIVPDPTAINAAAEPVAPTDASGNPIGYESIACIPSQADPTKLFFPSPSDMIDPAKRTFSGSGRAATLVMTDVVSCHVQILKAGAADFEDPFDPKTGLNTFDSSTSLDRVVGVRIILRIMEPVSGMTRQITIVQDL